MEMNTGIRCRLKVESRMERGVVRESGKAPVAQEQLGMKLLKMEEKALMKTYFGWGEGRPFFHKSSQFTFQFLF